MGTAAGAAVIGGTVVAGSALGPGLAASASPVKPEASAALTKSALSKAAPVPVPKTWSQTADVVVVGYGGAGAVAAMTAFDAGANVLILEKTPSLASLGIAPGKGTPLTYAISGGGGNTHICGGQCVWPTDPIAAATHLYDLSWGTVPMDVCQAWATVANGNKAWYDKMGIAYTVTPGTAEFPNVPGSASISRINTTASGAGLFQAMDLAVQKRGIPILFNAAATDLIQDPTTNEILGVQALYNNSEVLNVKANSAVVICTGGFEYNEAMKANYLKQYPDHFWGWQYNTGDGINMALKAGAGLWHMNAMSANLSPWWHDSPSSFLFLSPANNYIYVNKYGQRWCNESDNLTFVHTFSYETPDFNLHVPEYTRIPTFIIFDETARKTGPMLFAIFGGSILPPQLGGAPAWSADNSVEIANGKIIKGATSLADLANAINSAKIVSSTWPNAVPITFSMDPNVLTATVNAWNQAVAAKSDTLFGRAASTMAAIQTPPFYAMALWPGGPNTQGGPIRNAKGQVCDPDNNPIPRLYRAGEIGSIWGYLYASGGGDISECIAFGQITGNNAATEVPVS